MNLIIIGIAVLLAVAVQWWVIWADRDLCKNGVDLFGLCYFTHLMLPTMGAAATWGLLYIGLRWSSLISVHQVIDTTAVSSLQGAVMGVSAAIILAGLFSFTPLGGVLLLPFLPLMLFKGIRQQRGAQ